MFSGGKKKATKNSLNDSYALSQWEKAQSKSSESWDTILPYTPSPTQKPRIRRVLQTCSFSLKSKRFEAHIRHHNFEDLHLRDELPKHLALETNGAGVHIMDYNNLRNSS